MSIDLYSYQACLGTLVIDWANRTFTLAGMDGDGGEEMTVADVQATFAAHANNDDIEVSALVFWPENEQLCAHDEGSFANELEHDREIKGDDEEDGCET
jgi:hypothetical protein